MYVCVCVSWCASAQVDKALSAAYEYNALPCRFSNVMLYDTNTQPGQRHAQKPSAAVVPLLVNAEAAICQRLENVKTRLNELCKQVRFEYTWPDHSTSRQ